MTKLEPLHIQACYSAALQHGRKDGRPGGLSALTILHHHRILREALQHAVRWQLRAGNPADAVEPPRPRRKEIWALDEEQTAHLLTLAAGITEYMPILLAATTGMRRGEVLAVRWTDIDLDRETLAVRQSLEQTKQGLSFKEPKRPRSRRVIALPALVVEELRRHKAEQSKSRLMLGSGYHDHGLVFPAPDGRPQNPNTFSHRCATLFHRAGLNGVGFHTLRHSHASQLLRQDVHPKVVSERLGHSTIAITLDIYSHLLPGMQEDAADRIDTALRQALAKCAAK